MIASWITLFTGRIVSGGYGLQDQCAQGLLPRLMDHWVSQAAEAIFASGSNGLALAQPALLLAQFQVLGINWNSPEAPDREL